MITGKRMHSTKEAKAEIRRQRMGKPTDPVVRSKKILMMLVGKCIDDGTPPDAATLYDLNNDPLVSKSKSDAVSKCSCNYQLCHYTRL